MRPCRNIEHDNEHPVTLSGSLGHVNSSIGSIVSPLPIVLKGRELCLCTFTVHLAGRIDASECYTVLQNKKRDKSVVYISLQARLLQSVSGSNSVQAGIYR